jgi:hypothetical protein
MRRQTFEGLTEAINNVATALERGLNEVAEALDQRAATLEQNHRHPEWMNRWRRY